MRTIDAVIAEALASQNEQRARLDDFTFIDLMSSKSNI